VELHVIKNAGKEIIVLLDDDMRIIMGYENISTMQKYMYLSNPSLQK